MITFEFSITPSEMYEYILARSINNSVVAALIRACFHAFRMCIVV